MPGDVGDGSLVKNWRRGRSTERGGGRSFGFEKGENEGRFREKVSNRRRDLLSAKYAGRTS